VTDLELTTEAEAYAEEVLRQVLGAMPLAPPPEPARVLHAATRAAMYTAVGASISGRGWERRKRVAAAAARILAGRWERTTGKTFDWQEILPTSLGGVER
jgi:hypothetical protein